MKVEPFLSNSHSAKAELNLLADLIRPSKLIGKETISIQNLFPDNFMEG
jgi:hypothetical protein